MKTSIEIAGHELIVEYDFEITASGSPESGPSYYSGGEPAEPAEFELTVLGLSFPTQHDDVQELEMPEWLKDIIVTHLYARYDINNIVQRADRNRGPDADDERDRMNEDREIDNGNED